MSNPAIDPVASVAAASTALATTRLTLTIPTGLLTRYEAQALLAGVDVETHLARHLFVTADHLDAESGCYLRPDEMAEIRRLLGGRVNTGAKLLEMIGRLMRMKVAGTQIEVSPTRQEAMVWWARSMQLPLEKALPIMYDQALGMLLKC